MENILLKFSSTPAPLTRFIYAWMGLIWAVVLWAAITSLRGESFSPRQRKLWIMTIVGVPVLGLLAYLVSSYVKTADKSRTSATSRGHGREGR